MKSALERAQDVLQRVYLEGPSADGVKQAVEYTRLQIQLYGIDMAFLGGSVGLVFGCLLALLYARS